MKTQILIILNEIRPDVDFKNESNFIENGMLDSLDTIRLIAELEITFSISINGSDITPENFNSLNNIEGLVLKMKYNQNGG
jgi:acyl carrier protein